MSRNYTRNQPSRRRLLQCLTGAAAAPVGRFSAHAVASEQPLRFIGMYMPHGICAPFFNRRFDETETNYDLKFENSVLSPLDDPATYGRSFKDNIVTIEGIDLEAGIEAGTNGHSAAPIILSGSAPDGDKTNHSSLDQFLAVDNGLGKDTLHSSVVLAIGNNTTRAGWNMSFAKTGAPIPKLIDPAATFSTLFADLLPSGDGAAAERQRQRGASILDFNFKDLNRLMSRLPSYEKAKLDQHLESLREIERQIESVEDAVCDRPDTPKFFDEVRSFNGAEPFFKEITEIQIDLLAQALACDITRFGTLFLGDLSRTKRFAELPQDIHQGLPTGLMLPAAHTRGTAAMSATNQPGTRWPCKTASASANSPGL